MMAFNRANSNGCPCKECGERVAEPNCHMTCGKYIAWQGKMGSIKEAERKHHESNDTMSDAKKRALWKSKRYSRQQTYLRKIDTR